MIVGRKAFRQDTYLDLQMTLRYNNYNKSLECKKGENMIKDNLVFTFEKGALRVFIIGEINHHNVAKMREKIDEKIRKLSPEKVVLDLSQLNFMDSSGFGFIIGRKRALQETQAELVIENPNKNIFNILKSCGTDKIIKIVNSK